MGCSSSKQVDADVFRPPPTSFAIFDINSIQEPWIVVETTPQDQKPAHVPAQILEKLNSFESDPAPPNSWVEVSKVLEDLKPTFQSSRKTLLSPENPSLVEPSSPEKKPSKLRTVEELDRKLASPKPTPKNNSPAPSAADATAIGGVRRKSLVENIFIKMDREEREKEGKLSNYEKMMKLKLDPLGEFPEKCPPGGEDGVVVYTTSVRGVRKTYEDCNRVRTVLELHRVVFDERDVSLHGGFLLELKGLLGEDVTVPQVFFKGRHVGGADRVVELNETGRLGRILTWAGVERGMGRVACMGCGGARFIPCLDCGGSCKLVVGKGISGEKERCPHCNENGLVLCPACL